MMRSAHSTKETYIEVLPHLAPQFVKSASVTPRAREQAPQAETGIRLATIFSIVSVNGGQPTGWTESTVALRIRYVASAVRKICTLLPASDNTSPWEKTNKARVGRPFPKSFSSECSASSQALVAAEPGQGRWKP